MLIPIQCMLDAAGASMVILRDVDGVSQGLKFILDPVNTDTSTYDGFIYVTVLGLRILYNATLI